MRKIYLFCLSFLLIGLSVNSQVVLSESFEGTTFPPTGWTLINAGTGNNWTQNTTSAYAYHGTKSMQYAYSTTSAANAWSITPALALNGAQAYYITFFVRVRSDFYPENLKLTVGNSNTVAAQTTTLLDSSGLTNIGFRKWSAVYTPAAAGNFYFGFNCYSPADQFNLYVDSVTIVNQSGAAACTGTPNPGTITPPSNVLCSSGSVLLTFNSANSTSGITNQWQQSPAGANTWSNIAGVTSNTYTANISTSTDFRVITTCTGSGLSATSAIATVTLSGPPANDLVCDAIALTLNGTSNCQNTTCATATGDPAFSVSTPNNTVWYTYTPTVTGPVQAKFKRPAGVITGLLNGWLGVYTASGTCPSLTLTEVTGNTLSYDLTASDSVTVITTSLTAGTTYYFMIDGVSSAFGSFCIQLLAPPAAPLCTTNISPANGATNVTYLPSVQLTWNAVAGATGYDIYFSSNGTTYNNLGTTAGTTIGITGTTPLTTYYWYIAPRNAVPATTCQSTATSFTTSAVPAPPANDSCGAPIALTPAAAPVNGTTVSASQSIPAAVCSGFTSARAKDVWYSVRALYSGSFTVTVVGNGAFDPVVGIYRGACGALTLDTCRDASGATETVTLSNAIVGNTYLIRVYGYGSSTDSIGTFTITASGPALPVTGMVLSGNRNGGKAQLSWQTLTEINNAGFELQRSADGRYFTGIANINSKAANGNSTAAINYNADDVKPFSGANYYRLKQTDKDGKISYSNIVYLKGLAVNNLTLSALYPNPATDMVKAAIQAPAAESITLVVTDMMGKVISRQVSNVVSGDNTININVANLPSGSYLLKAICRNGCESAYQKFTKQ